MKKVLLLILLFMPLCILSSAESKVPEAVGTVTFYAEDNVLIGFSNRAVGDLFPVASDNIYQEGAEINFTYDVTSRSFMTPTFYYYVQAFTSSAIEVNLLFSSLKGVSSDGTATTTYLPFDLVISEVTSNSSDNISADGSSSSSESGSSVTLVRESAGGSFSTGRHYSGSVHLEVPVDVDGIDIELSYRTVLTMEVKAV